MGKSHSVRIAVIEERLSNNARELKRQAKEYERRLLDLNHAHDKQVADQQTYISEDKFAGYVSKIDEWQRSVSKTLSELEGRTGGVGSARTVLQQNVTLILLAVGVIVAIGVAFLK